MSDLKDIFKKRYEAEVNPQFSDDAWQKFMQYREDQTPQKKNRNFLFWIFLGIFTLVGGSAYLVHQWKDQHMIVQQYQEENSSPAIIEKQAKTSSDQTETTTLNSESSANTSTDHKNNNTTININATTKQRSTSFAPSYTSATEVAQEISDTPNPSFIGETISKKQINIESSPIISPDNPVFEDPSIQEVKKKETGQWLKEAILVSDLGRKEVAALDHDYNFDPYITPVHRISYSPKWSTEVTAGYGNPMHRSIRNYKQQVYGIAQHYKISSQWSIHGIATLQSLNYTSQVQNLRLGLRSVPLPRSSMNLDEITSQTTYLETGVGVAYTQPLFSGMSLRFGPQVLYIKELSRKLDYQFSDMENNMEAVSTPLEELTSHPYNLGINLSLQYQLVRDLQVGVNGTYITSLQNSRQILPNQWRLSIGITKNY